MRRKCELSNIINVWWICTCLLFTWVFHLGLSSDIVVVNNSLPSSITKWSQLVQTIYDVHPRTYKKSVSLVHPLSRNLQQAQNGWLDVRSWPAESKLGPRTRACNRLRSSSHHGDMGKEYDLGTDTSRQDAVIYDQRFGKTPARVAEIQARGWAKIGWISGRY